MKKRCLLLSLFFVVLVACGGSESDVLSEAEDAFNAWAEQTGIPYRNESFTIESNDDTFASVQVIAELRPEAESDWYEYTGLIECSKVGDNWQCNDSSDLTLSDEGATRAVQATGEAEQHLAEAIQLEWGPNSSLAGPISEDGRCIVPEVWETQDFFNPIEHIANFKIVNTDSVAYEVELEINFITQQGGQLLTPDLRQTHVVEANSTVQSAFATGGGSNPSIRYLEGGLPGGLVPADVPVLACIDFVNIEPR